MGSNARELDIHSLDYAVSPQRLGKLVARLASLVRLDINVDLLNAHLLAQANSHSTLATVAMPASITQLEMLSSCLYNADVFHALVRRGAGFSRLTINDEPIFHKSLIFRDLNRLDLFFDPSPNPPNWLPLFSRRHTHLTTIKFTVYHSGIWGGTGLPFAKDFSAAVNAEHIRGVQLNSFSIIRPRSWGSLEDWTVDQVVLNLYRAEAISVLKAALSVHAPHVSGLELILREWEHAADEFVVPFGGQSPWTLSQQTTTQLENSTAAVTALRALQWYMTRVAQQATGLEVIHVISDQGSGGEGRMAPWSVHASFRVLRKEARELEIIRSPKLYNTRGLPRRSYKGR
ncbi:hypothetical protein C8R45DRAFT_1205918 [Mycena sanguinolenta]|nr:hypothetical protein C8R45DRAFT_1205918 [Mycena sanguinolenta]